MSYHILSFTLTRLAGGFGSKSNPTRCCHRDSPQKVGSPAPPQGRIERSSTCSLAIFSYVWAIPFARLIYHTVDFMSNRAKVVVIDRFVPRTPLSPYFPPDPRRRLSTGDKVAGSAPKPPCSGLSWLEKGPSALARSSVLSLAWVGKVETPTEMVIGSEAFFNVQAKRSARTKAPEAEVSVKSRQTHRLPSGRLRRRPTSLFDQSCYLAET